MEMNESAEVVKKAENDANVFKLRLNKEKREKISMLDKERLIRAHDEGTDYIDLGEKLGLNRHSVNSIISRYRKTGQLTQGKRGGHKKPIITDEIGVKLVEFVEENPLRTLREMRDYLTTTFDINLSFQTISNFMHGKCVSIRKVNTKESNNNNNTSNSHFEESTSINKNSEDVKNRRHDYVKSILDNGISMKQCIFVDECVFNFWIVSPYGKSSKGTRTYKHCCGQKETNVTVCMAIATTGVVHYKVYFGSINKSNFEEFVLELSMQLGDGHFYIIQDCSSVHSPIVPAFENHQMVFLPPHSGFLNPINTVFDKLRAMVKQKVPQTKDIIKMSMSARKESLKRVIEEIIPIHFYSSMNNDYSLTVKYFSKCISKEDIL